MWILLFFTLPTSYIFLSERDDQRSSQKRTVSSTKVCATIVIIGSHWRHASFNFFAFVFPRITGKMINYFPAKTNTHARVAIHSLILFFGYLCKTMPFTTLARKIFSNDPRQYFNFKTVATKRNRPNIKYFWFQILCVWGQLIHYACVGNWSK